MWEGHTRSELEKYVDKLGAANGDRVAIADAVVGFIKATTVGFTDGSFANVFRQDVAEECQRVRRKKPAKIQILSRMIADEPNHRGASKVLARIAELKAEDKDFRPIQFDAVREFYEGTRLGEFETADAGLAELSHRRTYSRPSPPPKSISTIHKSKGLECHSVVLAPCDAIAFPDNQVSRCLLYVAISRPTHRLMLVVPLENPSPLIRI